MTLRARRFQDYLHSRAERAARAEEGDHDARAVERLEAEGGREAPPRREFPAPPPPRHPDGPACPICGVRYVPHSKRTLNAHYSEYARLFPNKRG